MWAVATLVFFMLRIVPGDPLSAMLFDAADPAVADELRIKFGLDQPLPVQYAKWFWLVLQGDLGNSIYGSRIPVSQVLIEAAPRTLSLAALAFCRVGPDRDSGGARLRPADAGGPSITV